MFSSFLTSVHDALIPDPDAPAGDVSAAKQKQQRQNLVKEDEKKDDGMSLTAAAKDAWKGVAGNGDEMEDEIARNRSMVSADGGDNEGVGNDAIASNGTTGQSSQDTATTQASEEAWIHEIQVQRKHDLEVLAATEGSRTILQQQCEDNDEGVEMLETGLEVYNYKGGEEDEEQEEEDGNKKLIPVDLDSFLPMNKFEQQSSAEIRGVAAVAAATAIAAAKNADGHHHHNHAGDDSRALQTNASTLSQMSDDYDGEIDLQLVEQYDAAFNEFIAAHPKYLVRNANLVHNLRVTKLQKILEQHDAMESELTQQLEFVRSQKEQMVIDYQQQLKQAARRKAAREIHLQAHLAELSSSTRKMEVQMMWDLVQSSERRAKKQQALMLKRQHQKQQQEQQQQYNHQGPIMDRQELLEILPHNYYHAIREAALSPPTSMISKSNPLHRSKNQGGPSEDDVRQFQVDNALLMSQIQVLHRKWQQQQVLTAKKNNAWIESVLVRMDDKTLKKLKTKYSKKSGVPIP